MWIISNRRLREFGERHPDAREPLLTWRREVEREQWTAPYQVKARFADASILPGDRVVFNIKGNNYRLVVHIKYQYHQVYIRFIGTHAEYNRINAEEI